VLLEAMACGRPVVAARAGAFPELVDDSVGVLAAPNSATGMAEAIAALYERDLARVGAAARAGVLRQFTWQRAFHSQFAAYASLAASAGCRSRKRRLSSWVTDFVTGEGLTVSAAARAVPQGPHGWRRARARLSRASA